MSGVKVSMASSHIRFWDTLPVRTFALSIKDSCDGMGALVESVCWLEKGGMAMTESGGSWKASSL